MDGARVAIFEDQEGIRQILGLGLSAHGHTVALEVGDMDQAREVIDLNDIDDIDVVIVDGNLDTGTISGENGAEIARLIRSKSGRVAIIGFSASGHVEGADVDAGKDIKSVFNLISSL